MVFVVYNMPWWYSIFHILHTVADGTATHKPSLRVLQSVVVQQLRPYIFKETRQEKKASHNPLSQPPFGKGGAKRGPGTLKKRRA